MPYDIFQSEMASRGFTFTPLTWKQYESLSDEGIGFDAIVSIAMDVACGFDLADAYQANMESKQGTIQ
mgnify:CR=1 FL=1|tara:strand:- start:354 stop:557 length:204 start_codon:yes stop_codon:yes gene_type:complete